MKIQEKQQFGLKKVPVVYAMNSVKLQTGIDEVACSIGQEENFSKELKLFLELGSKINTDNSNWFSWKGYTITKVFISKGFAYYINTSYNGKAYNLAVIEIWDKNKKGSLKGNGRIILYGTMFRVEELSKKRFEDIATLCNGLKVCILDVKIDYFLKKGNSINDFKVEHFYKVKERILDEKGFIKEKGTKICEYRGGGRLESLSIGEKESKKIFIRIYDKKRDLEVKAKEALYKDYFENTNDIVRVEYRLMSNKLNRLRFESFRSYYKNFLSEIGVKETQYKPTLDVDLLATSEGCSYFQKTVSGINQNIDKGLDLWLFLIAIQKKRGNEYIKEEIKKYQYYLKNKEQIDDYKREYFKKKEQEEEENNEEKNKLWGKLLFELFL